jgi:curli biogenesis system outer membrane secretion channel CsgG
MRQFSAVALLFALAACSTGPTLENGGGSTDSGSAAGSASTNANSALEHCGSTLGTLEINEDQQAPWYGYLAQYQLPSTVPLLRLIVQQSNCFAIVDRAQAFANDQAEQNLAASGELRSNSHMEKGQMVAADYTMEPSVNFSAQGESGLSAAASVIPVFGPLAGSLAGGVKKNEASTTLLLVDNRSSVQIAASQGSAKNFDFGAGGDIFGFLGGVVGGGSVGAYSNSPEGKLITAAFMDSYNQMVESLRNYQAQNVQGGLGTGGTLKVQQ